MWIFFLVCQVFSPVYGLDVEIDQSEIQAKLEAKFPVKKTKGPFWIKLENPKSLLVSKTNQMGLTADMSFQLLSGARSGTIELLGEPTYDSSTGKIFLDEIKMSRFTVENGREDEVYLLKKLLKKALKKKLKRVKLYELKSDELKGQMLKAFLKGIRVDQKAVVMELGY